MIGRISDCTSGVALSTLQLTIANEDDARNHLLLDETLTQFEVDVSALDSELPHTGSENATPFHKYGENLDAIVRCLLTLGQQNISVVTPIVPLYAQESQRVVDSLNDIRVSLTTEKSTKDSVQIIGTSPSTTSTANIEKKDTLVKDSTVFVNGKLWSWATHSFTPAWIIVGSTGKIDSYGSSSVDTPIDIDSTSTTVDLAGKFVLPGLADAHMHVGLLGETFHQVNLFGCTSIAELCERLALFAKERPDMTFISGCGFDHEMMGAMPSRHDLDAVVSDRPVFLMRACWHIGVANTRALLDSDIEVDVSVGPMDGGEVDVDDAGKLTGVLREDACRLIKRNPATKEFQKQCLVDGLNECVRNGLTSVQTNDWSGEVSVLDVYKELERDNALPVRVHLTPVGTDIARLPAPVKATDNNKNNRKKHGEALMFSCDRIKLFSDGSLGAGTAALIQIDDADVADTNDGDGVEIDKKEGVLMHSLTDLTNLVKAARAKDYRVETHAIGDLAATMTLDAYEAAGVCPSERPILTHAQVLNDGLIDRMARMGIIADVQPSFVPTDAAWLRKRLHASKLATSYCWKTLLERRVAVAGGSDAPVESVSPFTGMYDAIFRPERINKSDEMVEALCYMPHECLTFSEALHLYTTGAAYAACTEQQRGRLQVGFDADFVVVDVDVNENPRALRDIAKGVDAGLGLQVWVGGKLRFDRAQEKQDASKHSNNVKSMMPLRSDAAPGRGGPSALATSIFRSQRPNPMQCACHGHA